MAAPRKYPEELRERAIRMAVDLRKDPATKPGALRRVGEQLGIHPETLRNWVNQAERAAVRAAIESVGATAVMLEDLGAQDISAEQAYLSGVRSSEVYVGMWGSRYGVRPSRRR